MDNWSILLTFAFAKVRVGRTVEEGVAEESLRESRSQSIFNMFSKTAVALALVAVALAAPSQPSYDYSPPATYDTVVALALVAVTLAAPSQPSYGYAPPATYDTVVALALVAVTLGAPSQPSYGYAPPATYDVRKLLVTGKGRLEEGKEGRRGVSLSVTEYKPTARCSEYHTRSTFTIMFTKTVVALALVAVTLAAPSQPSYGYAPPATYDDHRTSVREQGYQAWAYTFLSPQRPRPSFGNYIKLLHGGLVTIYLQVPHNDRKGELWHLTAVVLAFVAVAVAAPSQPAYGYAPEPAYETVVVLALVAIAAAAPSQPAYGYTPEPKYETAVVLALVAVAVATPSQPTYGYTPEPTYETAVVLALVAVAVATPSQPTYGYTPEPTYEPVLLTSLLPLTNLPPTSLLLLTSLLPLNLPLPTNKPAPAYEPAPAYKPQACSRLRTCPCLQACSC
ncbi:hypothetical protein C7M84_018037 [Penaeus vannamei]|uniref:Uncharacterized protein n=1 Tax=Penaeus vannamei TaxID=6689 RepID=A0A3R7PZ32_PENVA|nr:hypothetical protein C7M84_018037 [Penaeus vannamei]